MLDRRQFVALSSASALAPLLAPGVARAQAQAYPTRFVRLVVPALPAQIGDALEFAFRSVRRQVRLRGGALRHCRHRGGLRRTCKGLGLARGTILRLPRDGAGDARRRSTGLITARGKHV